jgi:hypothetical protein
MCPYCYHAFLKYMLFSQDVLLAVNNEKVNDFSIFYTFTAVRSHYDRKQRLDQCKAL